MKGADSMCFDMSEFDLDAEPMIQEPIVAIMTNGFDHIPENIEILKESAVVNGFNLMLMRHDKFGFRDYGSWWILIFIAPRSIAERFSRFYFENDKDVELLYVESIAERSSGFDDGSIYYDDQIIHVPTRHYGQYDVIPKTRFFNDGESQIWAGLYHLEWEIKHEFISFQLRQF